ncbi:hypothetical protein NPIL_673211 [Nephila pilipes]|uniref:Uncharacterized protein n=1 Tax=Nephila pilipes TaxID=299642 RepID=A0A8X6N357_NEPPI|nr:hypothetical protein NPIL_673211 [Nephila pilipes]
MTEFQPSWPTIYESDCRRSQMKGYGNQERKTLYQIASVGAEPTDRRPTFLESETKRSSLPEAAEMQQPLLSICGST